MPQNAVVGLQHPLHRLGSLELNHTVAKVEGERRSAYSSRCRDVKMNKVMKSTFRKEYLFQVVVMRLDSYRQLRQSFLYIDPRVTKHIDPTNRSHCLKGGPVRRLVCFAVAVVDAVWVKPMSYFSIINSFLLGNHDGMPKQ